MTKPKETKVPLTSEGEKPRRGRPPVSEILTPENISFAAKLQADGHSYDEIAERIGCGKTSVMRLLQKARGTADPDPVAFTVTRTGTSPLAFTGILRCQETSKFIQAKPEKPNPNYWIISVYEVLPASDPPRFVVSFDYHKHYKGTEIEHHTAVTTSDVAAALRDYDPLKVLSGYPPGPRFANQQQQLEDACRRQFDELVSNVLKPFPEAI